MSDDSEDEEGGYRQPPKKRRWKKGQSGNPKRRYPRRSRSGHEWTYQLLFKSVSFPVFGEPKMIPTLEAIVTAVSLQALLDDPRALALQLKFKEFSAQNSERKLEIEFVDSDYTRALATENLTEKKKNEDE